jgi:hypothetical protein
MKCLLCVLLFLSTSTVSAQWVKQRDPRVPSLRDGKPNLSALTPRASDGKPDLSGVWNLDESPIPPGSPPGVGLGTRTPLHFNDIVASMKPEDVQMEPWAEASLKEHMENPASDPEGFCQPIGEPSMGAAPTPRKIVQTPRVIFVLYEGMDFRQIFLDGHKVAPDAEPRYMGYSSGRWEGDTLVVETVGLNERSWLDRKGHPHSDALRITERFRRRDVGHLEVDVTLTDAKAYRRPIVYKLTLTLMPDDDLFEYFCTENEKDVPHYRK